MNFLQQHPIIDTVVIYFALGFVGTMPAKGTRWTFETFYDWFYDFAHVVINFIPPSRRPVVDQNPTQAVGIWQSPSVITTGQYTNTPNPFPPVAPAQPSKEK